MDRKSFLAAVLAVLAAPNAVARAGGLTRPTLSAGQAAAVSGVAPWVLAHPLLGEVRHFDGPLAPAGWMFCEGQVMRISAFPLLFAVLGISCGGDGRTTFCLPLSRDGRQIIAVTGAFGLRPAAIAAMRRALNGSPSVSVPGIRVWEGLPLRPTTKRVADKTPLWWPGTVATARQLSDQRRAMATRLGARMLTPHYRGAPRGVH